MANNDGRSFKEIINIVTYYHWFTLRPKNLLRCVTLSINVLIKRYRDRELSLYWMSPNRLVDYWFCGGASILNYLIVVNTVSTRTNGRILTPKYIAGGSHWNARALL
eukprot:sb/3477728/